MTTPIVRVIGHTKFLGVPVDLLPKPDGAEFGRHDHVMHGLGLVAEKQQDRGSDLARLTECAGRNCYDSYAQGRKSAEYHQHIKEVGHGSVCEHAVINFYLDNISRGCTHELVRHRAGCAISQRSTRYVDETKSEWIMHPLYEKFIGSRDSSVLKRVTENAVISCKEVYANIVDHIQAALIEAGTDKFTARKQARGAARGLLGNALCTSMVWSANIRALRTVLEQRANPAADAEIRVLANRIYEEAITVCPEYFDDYERVECPDGIGYGLTTKYRKI